MKDKLQEAGSIQHSGNTKWPDIAVPVQLHKKHLNACKSRNKRLDELGYADYRAYLASARWQERRAAYAAAHPSVCSYCGQPADDLHHVSYANVGAELDEDLQWMCSTHHWEFHEWGEVKPPTAKQAEQLKVWGVPEPYIARLTRGTAYTLIDDIFNCRRPVPR